MTNVLNWIKNNPITVVSIALALVAFGLFGYASMLNSALQERMAEQSRPLGTLETLKSQMINFPNSDPTQPELRVGPLTINQPVIEEYKRIFGEFDQQFQEIFAYAIARNRSGKTVILDGLFPSPASPALPFEARAAYRDRVMAFLSAPDRNDIDASGIYPSALNAGLPPSPERIADEIRDADESTYNAIVSARLEARETGLSDSENQEIMEAKRSRLIDVLQDGASQIAVYAQTDPREADFPFDIMPWASPRASGSPAVDDMWEGQMQLWVLGDVVSAIATANARAAEQAGAPGVTASVVKRLISLKLDPGYVGITSGGLADGGRIAAVETAERAKVPAPSANQPSNFVVSPTGRTSNGLFIVRYATLEAEIAFNKLPLLIDAIDAVNFMTIVDIDVSRVDEYEALNEGYFYGPDDVALMRMRIETVWFRDWLGPMIPAQTGRAVGQPSPDRDNNGDEPRRARGQR